MNCLYLLVSNRKRCVVVAHVGVSRQGNPSGVVASIPVQGSIVAAERSTIYPAQVAVNSIIAVAIVVTAHVDELCVDQSVITIVAEHCVIPSEVQQRHISQVDDVVGIAVDLISIVVQIVERCVKERSEGDAQDAVDDGGPSVGVPGGRGRLQLQEWFV